jgi:hypothetical protein
MSLGLIVLVVLAGGYHTAEPAQALAPQPQAWVADGPVSASVEAGGTLYIGGQFQYIGPATGSFASISADAGVPDLSMPRVMGDVLAMAPDGSGGWYIGGEFTTVGGMRRGNLAHIRGDHTVDPIWQPATNGPVRALAVHGAAVYVLGMFSQVVDQPRNSIAALDAAVGVPLSWNPDPDAGVAAMQISGDTLYVAGAFNTIGGQPRQSLAAFDLNTGTVTPWNAGMSSTISGGVHALAVSGSTVYIAGFFSQIGGQPRNSIAALDATSGLLTNWNPNANDGRGYPNEVYALAVSGTTIYAGGDFRAIGGQPRNNIAALDATSGLATAWNPSALNASSDYPSRVNALMLVGLRLYVGGSLGTIGGQPRSGLAALDTATGAATAWAPAAAPSEVRALQVSGGQVFVGGEFSSVGGQRRSNIAALDVATGAATAWNPGADSDVTALALGDGVLYVGGGFNHIAGVERHALAAFDLATGAATAWNPDIYADVHGYTGIPLVFTLAVSGTTVYAGGRFTAVDGQDRQFIAAIDAASGAPTDWNPGSDQVVNALAVRADRVYAGGSFTRIGGQWRRSLAALDVTTGKATAWSADVDGSVSELLIHGQSLYVAGNFSGIDRQARTHIAALDSATGLLAAWNPRVNGPVYALAARGDVLYLAGGFSSAGCRLRQSLAAVDVVSGLATAWNPDLYTERGSVYTEYPFVSSLAVDQQAVYAGGSFDGADMQLQPNLSVFPDPPQILSTEGATNVTSTGATLNGLADARGASATVSFSYTTTFGDYRQATTVPAISSQVSGTSEIAVSAQLSNLVPQTTYYYRVAASGSSGASVGNQRSFTTTQGTAPPTIALQPASQTIISGQTATLTAVASGIVPQTAQWYEGATGDTCVPTMGASATGSTLFSFTTPPLKHTTSYWVRITNAAGVVDSATATITVRPSVQYLPLIARR